MEDAHIVEIYKEFKKIDKKWLLLHYKTGVGVVILAFFVECCIGLLMYHTGEITTTIPIYLMKFLIIPSVLNALCILISHRVVYSKTLSQDVKIYMISIIFVVICFILFTAHSAFTALYFIFAIPMLLTTIYGDYKLTTITGVFSLVTGGCSEIFIKWDNDKVSIWGDGTRLGNFLISGFVLISFLIICMVVIRFEREKNVASIQKEMERYKLQQKLQIDELTKISNRIGLRNAIRDMEEDNSNNSYIFVMIDIDNFKRLNDSLGHVVGDQCLIEFGKILKANCGKAIPFRYGGDEFCILFQNHTLNAVIETCKEVQENFKLIQLDGNENLPLTISVGIANYTDDISPSKLIINTDKALYESKITKDTITVFKDSENQNEVRSFTFQKAKEV